MATRRTDDVIVEIGVKTTGQKILDEFADDVEALGKEYPVVKVGADTGKAEGDLEDVTEAAEAIDRLDPEVEVTADTSQAERAFKDLDSDASTAVGNVSGGIRNLSGPLGSVGSEVGDFAEAFEEAGTRIGSAMGISEGAISRVMPLLGGIGLAVGVIKLGWDAVNASQEEANARAQEYLDKLNEAEGNIRKAAELKLAESLSVGDLRDMKSLNLFLDDMAGILSGKAIPKWEEFLRISEKVDEAQRRAIAKGETGVEARLKVFEDEARLRGTTAEKIEDQVRAADRLNELLGDEESALRRGTEEWTLRERAMHGNEGQVSSLRAAEKRLGDELDVTGDKASDTSDELDDVARNRKGTVDVAVSANTASATSSVNAFERDAESRNVVIPVSLRVNQSSLRAVLGDLEDSPTTRAAGTNVTNVTVNMPAGASGRDVVTAQRRHARANGGLR